MPSSRAVYFGAAVAAAVALYLLRRRLTAGSWTNEDQARVDAHLDGFAAGATAAGTKAAASPGRLTSDEQRWIDAQIQKADEEDMLDDARQAAFAPGSGSTPDPSRPRDKGFKGK